MKNLAWMKLSATAALAVFMTACAGHGALPAPPSSPGKSTQANFVMHWPPPHKARPDYVSQATASISIQVNGNQPMIVNNPNTGGTTTVAIDAPIGTDSFAIKAYDQKGAQGHVLSQTQISQLIVAGKANTVSATLDGVIASIVVGLSTSTPTAGVAQDITVQVAAADASGNTIIGPYDQPITLSDSDKFATSLSSTSITGTGAAPTVHYNGNSIWSATISASASGVLQDASATLSPVPALTEYSIPTAFSAPNEIVQGPDGAMWFTEGLGKIGRVTTGGGFTEYVVPTSSSNPDGIAVGPDGALWFTEPQANRIGRITTGGGVTEFVVPTLNCSPLGIHSGPDGALWFTENNATQIGRITTSGTFTEFVIPTAAGPAEIVSGPDGALWFTDLGANLVGRVTTGGNFSEYVIPTASSVPNGITSGPDGALWFGEANGNKIGRITPSGNITEFSIPTGSSNPWGIVSGLDGALWFGESFGHQIGRITTSGTFAEYPLSIAATPKGLAVGPDGAIWYVDYNQDKVGKFAY